MRILLASVLLLVACKPEIQGDTYFCGPEELCPPNLQCDLGNASFAYNCVTPLAADPFVCPDATSDQEPDNSPEQANDIGVLSCGGQIAQGAWGCIGDGDDQDHYRLAREDECVGNNPRFAASLRYPVGSAPLSLELLDESGAVVATGVVCTPPADTTGTELTCIEEADLELGTYDLRIQVDDEANADCGGSCRFNRYQLFVSSPVS